MKKFTILCTIVIAFGLSQSANASLETDTVSGTATVFTDFADTVVVGGFGTVEFSGMTGVSGTSSFFSIDANISYDSFYGGDIIDFLISKDLTGPGTAPDFSITFSDFDWVGMPERSLESITVVDDFNFSDPGQGMTFVPSSDALTVHFTGFELAGDSRGVVILLNTTDAPVVPAPAGVLLGLIGLGGVGIKRLVSQRR